MIVIRTVRDLQSLRKVWSGTLGFVPTMGALHAGHGELIKKSLTENENTIVSVYVNRMQFNDVADFEKYPLTFEEDKEFLKSLGVDCLFAPSENEIYPSGFRYKIEENNFSRELCGASRVGHFEGVLTVVMKLLNIVKPTKAYFGEKDFQQLKLIEDMVRDFFMEVEVIPCPIVRETSGLAMSSRNKRLSSQGLKVAGELNRILSSKMSKAEMRAELIKNGFQVDYIEEKLGRRFVAAFIEGVRLIDNVRI